MTKLTKEQLEQIACDKQITFVNGNINGFFNINGKKEFKVWVKFDDTYYTDDNDYYDEWISSRNGITVDELRVQRLKEKTKVNEYFVKKANQLKN